MISRPRLVFLLIFSFSTFLAVRQGLAQDHPATLLDVADAFFEQENYDASATEYLRFLFFAPNDPSAYYAYYKLGLAEHHLGRQEEAIYAFRQSARSAASTRHRQYASYRLALVYLSAQQWDRAKLELLGLALNPNHQDHVLATQSSIVAGIMYAFQAQWEQTGDMLQRAAALQEGNEPFQEKIAEAQAIVTQLASDPAPKSPQAAKWASSFLPGSGQIYAGHLGNGLTALAINVGTSYLLYRSLAAGSYLNAILLASSLWWRYYQGNRLHAEEAAIQVNQRYRTTLEDQLYLVLEEASQFLPMHNYVPLPPEHVPMDKE